MIFTSMCFHWAPNAAIPSAVNRSTTCAGGRTGASCGGDVGGSGWADAASINGAMASTAPTTILARSQFFMSILPFLMTDSRAARSFDHLVGAGEQHRRSIEVQCPGGLQIHNCFILGGCLHWQVARLFALEDAVHVARRPPKHISDVGAVGDQSAAHNKVAIGIDRWQPML